MTNYEYLITLIAEQEDAAREGKMPKEIAEHNIKALNRSLEALTLETAAEESSAR